MNSLKSIAILLISIMAFSSVLIVDCVSAQSIPTPQVPEFTIQITDRSYDVPPTTTTTTDPYTGKKTQTTTRGYRVENKTVDLIIKNSQFKMYSDGNGNVVQMYYLVRSKGHFTDEWISFTLCDGYQPSNTEYTTITFLTSNMHITNYPVVYLAPDSQTDFRVQTKIGFYYYQWVSAGLDDHPLAGGEVRMFNGTTSDWSNIQTLNANDNSIVISASADPEPTQTLTQTSPTPSDSSIIPFTESPTAKSLQSDSQNDLKLDLSLWQTGIVVLTVIVTVLALSLLCVRGKVQRKPT